MVMLERRLHPVSLPKLTEIELQELQHMILVAGDDRPSGMVRPLHLPATVVQMANDASVRGARWVDELPDLDSLAVFGPDAPPD